MPPVIRLDNDSDINNDADSGSDDDDDDDMLFHIMSNQKHSRNNSIARLMICISKFLNMATLMNFKTVILSN